MDTLTKICVVVLVVVAPVAAGLSVRQASLVPNYKYKFQQERMRSEGNALQAADEALAHKSTLQQAAEKATQSDKLISDLRGKVVRLEQALGVQKVTNTSLENKLTSIQSSIVEMSKTDKQRVQRNQALTEQVASLRRDIDAENAANTRLTKELRQKSADYDRVELIGRSRLERISELEEALKERVKQLSEALAGRPIVAGAAPLPEAGAEITGTITAVIPAENVASINVGSAQGVRKGMKLVIYRGAKLVGWLRIEDVELQQAAGIIVEKQIDPMQGDKVATSESLVK